MTVATTDGETTWAFRYSSEGRSRSLFRSTDVATLRLQYPDNPVLHRLSDDARLVVSEPLGDLRGAWSEVPESACLTVREGAERLQPFAPTGGAAGVMEAGKAIVLCSSSIPPRRFGSRCFA